VIHLPWPRAPNFLKRDDGIGNFTKPAAPRAYDTGAIVAGIVEGTVAAAVAVWLRAKLIRGPDRAFHLERCRRWGSCARVPGTIGPEVGNGLLLAKPPPNTLGARKERAGENDETAKLHCRSV